jgi:hypothetical protein
MSPPDGQFDALPRSADSESVTLANVIWWILDKGQRQGDGRLKLNRKGTREAGNISFGAGQRFTCPAWMRD